MFLHKLILAKDAVKTNGTFPRTPPYIEECQYPEAFDPNMVLRRIVICTFSAGFFNGSSTLTAIIDTAKTLGFMGFVLVANPTYGDFIAEPVPIDIPGILIPNIASAEVLPTYHHNITQLFLREFSSNVTKF